MAKVIIERLPSKSFVRITGVGARSVSQRVATYRSFAVFTNPALLRVIIVVGTLLHDSLKGRIHKGVAAKMKLLYHSMISGE
jgi:hypothetical protein